MKKVSLLLWWLCLYSVTVIKAQNADVVVRSIKAKYQQLRAELKTYRVDSMDLPDQSTEGGVATAWYKGKDLKILKAIFFGETGKTEWNYYYDSSKLIFALKKDYNYNNPMYLDEKTAKENHVEAFNPKKTRIEESRFYFYDNKIIRWLDTNGRLVSVSTKDNRATIMEMIAEAYKLQRQMRK